MYPPPTTRVFPGFFSSEKRSSEVIHSSSNLKFEPGLFGRYFGLPPVAITMFFAFKD
jgi:hypothetical protein